MLKYKGLCTCDECGAQCEVGQALVLTVDPPIYVHEYDCKKCRNHGQVKDKDINWVPEEIVENYFGAEDIAIEHIYKEKETKVNDFLDDLLEHNPILITMDLENMRKIANGYLDQISTLYSLVASTYKNAIENGITPHMDKINEQLENAKEDLIAFIKKNIKTDWCQKKESREGKVTGTPLGSIKIGSPITVGSGELKLEETDPSPSYVRLVKTAGSAAVLDTAKE